MRVEESLLHEGVVVRLSCDKRYRNNTLYSFIFSLISYIYMSNLLLSFIYGYVSDWRNCLSCYTEEGGWSRGSSMRRLKTNSKETKRSIKYYIPI